MTSRQIVRRRRRRVAVLGVAALVSAVAAAPTLAAIAPSTFDALNGDFETSSGTDWEDLDYDDLVAPGSKLDSGEWTYQDDVLPPGQNDDSFTQGTWENTEPPVPSTGSVPPNKSDLTRFYVGVENAASDRPFLYLGWLRVLNPKGTTNMDFEFNQSETLSANGVTPERTHGDVLVEYKLAKGGDTPIIFVYKWNEPGETEDPNYAGCEGSTSKPCWSERNEVSAAGGAEGSVNTVAIDEPTGGTSTDFLPTPDTADPYTFGEASIDLEGAGLFTPGDCTTFGSAYLKSRSSDSFTAALKDFIAPKKINLSNCGQFTVVKETVDDAEGSFDFTVSPPAGTDDAAGDGDPVEGGTLADADTTSTDPDSFTAYNVAPDDYDITETPIPTGGTSTPWCAKTRAEQAPVVRSKTPEC